MTDPGTATAFAIQLAITVATTLLQAILAKKQKLFGPRLSDTKIESATFGRPIQRGYGTIRMAAQLIAGRKRETTKTKTLGKGGLFSAGTQTSFEYFADLVFCLGSRPVAGVTRIWANNKLIYDSRSASGEASRMKGLVFRVLDGNPDQMPDPVMIRIAGAENAPAYRGVSTFILDDLPLQEWGGAVPLIEVEAAFAGADALPISVPMEGTSAAEAPAVGGVVWDRERNVAYSLSTDSRDTAVLQAHDLRTGALLASRPLAESSLITEFGGGTLTLRGGSVGDWLVIQGEAIHSGPKFVASKATLAIAGKVGRFTTSTSTTSEQCDTAPATLSNTDSLAVVQVRSLIGLPTYWAFGGYENNTDRPLWAFPILSDGTPVEELVWGCDVTAVASLICVGIQAGPQDGLSRPVYFAMRASGNTGSSGVLSIWVTALQSGFGPGQVGLLWTDAAPSVGRARLAVHEATGALIVDTGDAGRAVSIDLATGAENWSVPGSVGLAIPRDQVGVIEAGRAFQAGMSLSEVVLLDPVDGSEIERIAADGPWTTVAGSGNLRGNQVWDDAARRLYSRSGSAIAKGLNVLYGKRVEGAAETLADVVTDLATLGSLTPDRVDATALQGDIEGFLINRPESIRDSIGQLALAHDFDGAEIDGKLRFFHFGATAARSIPEIDLVRREDGVWTETTSREVNLPLSVSVTTLNPEDAFQETTQERRRPNAPARIVGAANSINVELALALDPNTGRAIAERLLVRPWIERDTGKGRLRAAHADLNPGDVVSLTVRGRTALWRITQATLGPDYTLEIEAVRTHPNAFLAPSLSGVSTIGSPDAPGDLTGDGARITPWVLDVPLLRDIDDPGQASFGLVAASARDITARALPWRANAMLIRDGGGEFETVAAMGAEAIWGVAVTALAPMPGPDFWSLHEVSFTAHIIGGAASVASVTQDALIAQDANSFALRNGAGQWEIIGVRDVTALGDGRFTFAGLMRGKRGTEWAAGAHVEGGLLIALTPATLEGFRREAARVGGDALAVAALPGQAPDLLSAQPITWAGNSLRPLAPAHITATLVGGDIVISADRRTRIGGTLVNGTTPPLSEAAEAYEVDVLDGGGAVARTLSAGALPIVYPAADVAADWGAPPTSLTLRAYQISAVVGRGFSNERTVTVQ